MAKTTSRPGLARAGEAAAYLGRKPKTLANWRSLGIGPEYVGTGQGVRYPWRALDAWIEANTRNP